MAEVLVVEDNPQNMRLACLLLRLAGHTTLSAEDVPGARQILSQRRPDLLLVDIQLPGVDGVQFVRELRSRPATRHFIVVAMTAYAMRGDRERFLAAGFDGYLPKPLDVATFGQSIQDFLRVKHAA
jgi:two-component system, cell cycle response regulator DivK